MFEPEFSETPIYTTPSKFEFDILFGFKLRNERKARMGETREVRSKT